VSNAVPHIAQLVEAAAAVGAVTIAGLGLGTWRRQLRGTTEYDLARRLLLQVYRLRDAIDHVRQPFMSIEEAGERKEGVPWEIAAYDQRWQGVREAMVALAAAVAESEVLWGSEVTALKVRFARHVMTLRQAIEALADTKVSTGRAPTLTSDQRITLYSGSTRNAYSDELAETIGSFEDLIKPHLPRLRDGSFR
jgi:hypothetical protein